MDPEKAKTLEQAQDWFSKNSSGSLTCVRDDGTEKSCASLTEAQEFFAPAQTTSTEG